MIIGQKLNMHKKNSKKHILTAKCLKWNRLTLEYPECALAIGISIIVALPPLLLGDHTLKHDLPYLGQKVGHPPPMHLCCEKVGVHLAI